MTDTKDKILMTALQLFARDGYEAVSVSTIAGELGITKGALYKHYKNKRDIFDNIVERMFEIDAERAQQYEVPKETYEETPTNYEHISIKNIQNFTVAQFVFWTEDVFASNFRKMLTLEQYRNPEMAELYHNCITSGPVSYIEDIFREMIAEGRFPNRNPKQLAIEFYAPMYLLIHMSDHIADLQQLQNLLTAHIQKFMQTNTVKKTN